MIGKGLGDKNAGRGAMIFLLLFALPFAGVGTFVGYTAGSMIASWTRAQSWEQVPARILSTNLEANSDGDTTTYRVEAVYEYAYRGERHTSDVVSFGFGSDNIGSFHQDKHAELQPYVDSERRFRCFVDPDDPSAAVLYRDMRWGLLGLMTVFALVFGLVGYGLMFAAVYGSRLAAAANQLKASNLSEPWRWDQEWADGRVSAGAKGSMIGTAIFAVLWNLISAPVLFFVPTEVVEGNHAALLALVFPAVGLLLMAWAVRAFLRWRKFGSAVFELSTNPGALGGHLEGQIHTNIRGALDEGFEVSLTCTRTVTTGSGDNRSSHDDVLWQDAVVVPRGALGLAAGGLTVPVRFTIPMDAAPASDPDADQPIHWKLSAEAEMTGVDFAAEFKVPVFKTDASDPDLVLEPAHVAPVSAHDWAAELAAQGIAAELTGAGGRRYVFRRARHKGVAAGLTAFTVVWCGFIWMMVSLGAPILFPILFGLLAAVMVWFVLDLWLTELRVEVSNGTLAITKRMLGRGRSRTFECDQITAMRPTPGMQANNKLYYRIELQAGAADAHVIATQLDSQRLARRLISEMREALGT